jgi:hypothetical protein
LAGASVASNSVHGQLEVVKDQVTGLASAIPELDFAAVPTVAVYWVDGLSSAFGVIVAVRVAAL